jgi:hypothetical protein
MNQKEKFTKEISKLLENKYYKLLSKKEKGEVISNLLKLRPETPRGTIKRYLHDPVHIPKGRFDFWNDAITDVIGYQLEKKLEVCLTQISNLRNAIKTYRKWKN